MVAVFRHGDRTPKQKMKMTTTDPKFLAFFKGKTKNVKLKHPRELQKILQIAHENVKSMLQNQSTDINIDTQK